MTIRVSTWRAVMTKYSNHLYLGCIFVLFPWIHPKQYKQPDIMDSNPELLPVSIYSEFLEWLQNSRLKRLGNFTYIYDLLQHMTYITLPTKVHLVKAMVFSSSHVWMWELDYKESWAPKNWRFWTGVLEKTLESPVDCKEIQSVHPKGNQSWIFIGRTDAEAETPILWPPDVKNWLIGKDPDDGKDWGQEEKGTTEDEMVEWHHQLDGHKSG